MAGRADRRPDDDTGHPWFAAFVTALALAPLGGAIYAALRVFTDLLPRHAAGLACAAVVGPAFLALFWPRGVAGRIVGLWRLFWIVLKGVS